jgi:hypothetical protein
VRKEVWASVERKGAEKAARREEAHSFENIDEIFLATANDNPRTYKEAMESEDAAEWEKGYDNEMASLKAHNIWKLVPRSEVLEGKKIVGSRPCFTHK